MFLDTNVLVSAFTTRGLCADLLRLVLAEHELLSGEVILEELRRVLLKRFGVPSPLTDGILDLVRGQATVLPQPARPAISGVSDPDDEWVIASALAGKADVLVTGDKALLILKAVDVMPILDPRGFWQHLKAGLA
ncbi:MAG: putative toxin-antitoxin system toxin component, PIN family [Gammaproteobacteria bacterium]